MEKDLNTSTTGGVTPSQPTPNVGSQQNSGTVTEQAKHAVRNVANQATEKAGERVESGIARGKDRTARALGAVAQSLRSVSSELHQQNEQGIGRFVDRAADRADEMVNRLNNANPDTLLDDVEAFARREPAMFIGGAIAIGLLAARFLKSSRRSEARLESSAQLMQRASPNLPAERDVTDSLHYRDDMPARGPNGQPAF